MKMLRLRTNLHSAAEADVPFAVYTVGTERQPPITRLQGFSAKQLFLTFSGTGIFRPLGQNKWDIVDTSSLLYIPSGLPHEYVPQGQEPWSVGYVTFVEQPGGLMESWGYGNTPFRLALRDTGPLYALLEQIWSSTGPDDDVWRSTELLFAFCLELRKQARLAADAAPGVAAGAHLYRDSVVDSAIRFLHDHLQRPLTMRELSAHVGYSSKQLNRLFRQALGTTPLQYLQRVRLQTGALLLQEHPGMTIRQTAAQIGMEPEYFTRLFRRKYQVTPSQYRQ